MSAERAAELRNLLKEEREAYYNLAPMVPDHIYDAQKNELKAIDPSNEELTVVGADIPENSGWEKVAHTIPMGSLNKVNTEKEFYDWAEKTGASEFLITYKIDGSSMELVYKDGGLIRAVTRGRNSGPGENVFTNVAQIPNVPKSIDLLGDVSVRGEVVLYKDTFKEHYADTYANPRNTANGKVRERKNGGVDCERLNFIAYTIYVDGNLPTTELEQFEKLQSLGFEIPFYEVGNQYDLARVFEATKDVRENIHYEIDGMVVRINDISTQDGLGSKDLRPNGQTAWKFDAEMATSKIITVNWVVGPSGRVTPLASIEPTALGGVTIVSVSLHNLNMFRQMKLFPGCEILIARRGDVIPYIEKNLTLGIEAGEWEVNDPTRMGSKRKVKGRGF